MKSYKEQMKLLKEGDRVLATKYSDGDPYDGWCYGIYKEKLNEGNLEGRHIVVDDNGQPFRMNGFRRCQKISDGKAALIIPILHCGYKLNIWGLYKKSHKSLVELSKHYAAEHYTKDTPNDAD